MKIWLDDERTPPDDTWTWLKTIEDVKPLLLDGAVEIASLDNDLGDGLEEGRRLVLWMAENDVWPTEEIRVHSANPVAYEYMAGMITRYSGKRRVHPCGVPTFRWRRNRPLPGTPQFAVEADLPNQASLRDQAKKPDQPNPGT